MANIGTLTAMLEANTASFQRDLGKAVAALNSSSARMNSYLSSIDKNFDRITKAANTFISVWLLNKGREMVEHSLEFADSIANIARAANLSTDELQKFRFAMTQNGASAQQADAALVRFNQTIGDAANGSLEAQKALARVGVSLDDLKKQSVGELFIKASDNLSRMTDSTSAAVKAFGKEARDMGGAVSISAQEMNRLGEEAKQTGAVLSAESIEKAKQVKDKFEQVSNVLNVQFTQAIVSLSPLLIKGAELLAKWSDSLTRTLRSMGLLSKATDDEQRLHDLEAQRLDLIEGINNEQRKAETILGKLFSGSSAAMIAKLNAELAETNKQIAALKAKGAGASTTTKAAPAATQVKMADEVVRLIASIEKANEEAGASMIADDQRAALVRVNIQAEEFRTKMQLLGLWVDASQKAATQQQLDAMAAYKAWQDQAERAAKFVTDPSARLLASWRETTQQLREASASWLNDAADKLTDFVMTGKLKFSDFANAIIRDLVRIQIQAAIANVLGPIIGLPPVPARAEGGPVMAGQTYLVGERGPELFTPSSSGAIIPNNRLGGSGGGIVVYQTNNFQSGVTRQELAAMLPAIVEKTKAAVADSVQRGGRYAAAFQG